MVANERLTHVREYAVQCIKDEAQAVMELLPQLDDNFDKAVALMYGCHGKVIVTGVGKSGHIGAKIAATLSSTGTPSFFINPLDVYHGDLGVMTKDDVAWPSFTPASNPKMRGIVFVPSITTNAATIIIMAFRMGTSNKSIAKIQLVNNW